MKIKNWLLYSKILVYIVTILLFLLFSLGGITQLQLLLSILSILSIILSLPQANIVTKFFSFAFLIFGTIFMLNKGANLYEYVGMYGEMLSLLSLFAIIPILALPIKIGGYGDAVKVLLMKEGKTSFQYYKDISIYSYLFAIFLNLATIPVMYESFKSTIIRSFKTNHQRLLSSSILQGYALPLIWTPFSAMVGIIITFTGVTWLSMFPVLLFISITTLLFNWLLFYLMQKNIYIRNDVNSTKSSNELPNEKKKFYYKKITEVGIAIILLIIVIALLDTLSSINILIIATCISIPFAFIWSCFIKKTQVFMKELKSHFIKFVPNMHNLFSIFLCAGFFVNTLNYTGIAQLINQTVLSFIDFIPLAIFLMILPLFTLFTAFFGLHPIVTIALLAQSLNPYILGIKPEMITLSLLGGAVLTFLVGPFSGTMGVASSIMHKSPFLIARWNILASVGFYIILTINILILY